MLWQGTVTSFTFQLPYRMKNIYLLLSVLVSIIMACEGCDMCMNSPGCADTFRFRVVRAGTHDDLVLGPDSIYHKDSVSLYTDMPYLSGHPVAFHDSSSFVTVLALPIDTFFLKLSEADTDTILMQYRFIKTKCCTASSRGYGQITGIQYNGAEAKKDGDIYLFEK